MKGKLIERILESDNIEELHEIIVLNNFALNEIETKINIINGECKLLKQYNPIEHVKTRVKTPKSIVKKLHKKGLDVSVDNINNNILDIAGVRVICSFKKDIFEVAKMIESQNDIEVVSVKDYVTNPKENGYQSYHMHVKVPVFLSEKTIYMIVEIQIRTSAMDFWASVEHKINYKLDNNMTEQLKKELRECSIEASKLDDRMYEINQRISKLNEKG